MKLIRPILLVVILFAAALMLGAAPTFAQTNLLSNPGFEPPFVNIGGNPLVQVAQGWTPWHVPQGPGDSSSQNLQPEYYPASDTTNGLGVPRIRSGADAQQYHTFFGTHRGGVFQRLTGLTAGTPLRFSVFVRVWSSSFDDPSVSEDDGGVLVRVGIDPTGGTDGQSGSIVWSAGVQPYDNFVELSVTGQAGGSAVTVWVESNVSFPVKNNVIYLDDAALTTGAAPLPPTNTSVPATNTPLPPTSPPAGATNTPLPATNTALPPTNTAVPPTNTAVVVPTATPIVPSSTPLPPSVTPSLSEFPGRIIHTVRPGDTVGRLAIFYGSTVEAIIAANGIGPDARIFVGQGLIIPIRTATPPTSAPVQPSATPFVPTAAPTQVLPGTISGPAPGTITYVVQPGDTLYSIALRFRTSITILAQLNRIANPNRLFVGQPILVPVLVTPPVITVVPPTASAPPVTRTYIVRPGDNLFRISLRFGVPMSVLIRANNLGNPNLIFIGQVLIIP